MQTPSKLKGLMMSTSEGRPTRVTTPALLLGSAPHRLSRAEEALQELTSPSGRGPRVLSSLTWRSRNERTKVAVAQGRALRLEENGGRNCRPSERDVKTASPRFWSVESYAGSR